MENMSLEERLRLMRFVCSFAWTDLRIAAGERALVSDLADRLGFGEAERQQVQEWLKVPPSPEEIDPLDIPKEHRQAFYAAAKQMVEADGRVVPGEADILEAFRELLHE